MAESERRASRRFNMNLPLTIRYASGANRVEHEARTRDVSFRGLYFTMETGFEPGMPVEFVLTLPKEVTMAGDVHIQCYGTVVRVEQHNDRNGIAARIDRYEFLPTAS
jgi:hypothetical protein